ncbi:MAG: dihydrolipoyl dehydrogenase [Bacteroidia bacterium]
MKGEIAIVGAGPGGYVAALRAAQLGKKVILIEKEPNLGGTCLNIGCIPSKALLSSSLLFWNAQKHLGAHGIQVQGVSLDWPAMQARKNAVVEATVKGVAYLMRKNAIEVVRGVGRFASAHQLVVEGDTTAHIEAQHIVIATGSQAAQLPGIPFDGKRVVSSTEALSLPEVPKSLVVIGAGVIGIELGTVYARLGSKVTIVEYLDRILPPADAEIAHQVQKFLTGAYGITFFLSHQAQAVHYEGEKVVLTVQSRQTSEVEKLEADYILVAVGRRPYTQGMELEKAGLSTNAQGQIPVDADRRTAVPHIYAIGDVVEGPMLAHKAMEEGILVAEKIAGHGAFYDVHLIPSVVYIEPEVAWVGANEETLQAQGIPYTKGVFPFRASGRARAHGDTQGLVKILADKKTDRLLGMHIWGVQAGDMISTGVMGLAFRASAEDLAILPYAHPGFAEAIKEAAWAAAYKSPLHL